MTAERVIDARDLSKSYGRGAGRFNALAGVTVHIDRGECVAIVGKSGSGKSTLMHILALLDSADSGTLTIDGVDAATLNPRQVNAMRNKKFGFVFQQFFLTAGTSVLDNVILPLKIAGTSRAERKGRGLALLQQFELGGKASSLATDLSGGQKQRVVISRALANQPSVIFADEPTGNLDSVTGAAVADALFALNREHGITVIIVTHDEELAARCDRQVFLRDGAVVAHLTPTSSKGSRA